MRALSASDLLEIWERGAGATPLEQALGILATVFPQASRAALASLTIAQRDAALFHLRELTFGPHLTGLAGCPICQERLELDFSIDELHTLQLLPDAEIALPGPDEPATLFKHKGYRLSIRPPTSADLMAASAIADPAQARQHLLEACILSASRAGRALAIHELPGSTLAAVAEKIEQREALANLTIDATCPACGHHWEIVFDIVSYFWSEINAWAVRMLHEIHTLASAYGWREADILAMSAWRRQRYLELIGV